MDDEEDRRSSRERVLRERIADFDAEAQSAWSLWYDLRHLARIRVDANDTAEATQLLIHAETVKESEKIRAPARECSLDRTRGTTTWARYAPQLRLASDRIRAGALEEAARLFVDVARARSWEEPPADVFAYLRSLVAFLSRNPASQADAEIAARAAIALAEAMHQSPHLDVLRAMGSLKACIVYRGRGAEVIAVEERIAALCEAIYGPTGPLAKALFSLAYSCGQDPGQRERALAVTHQAFAIVERVEGPDSPLAAWSRATKLAAALTQCGRIDDAIVEAERAYRVLSTGDEAKDDKPARLVRRQIENLRTLKVQGTTR